MPIRKVTLPAFARRIAALDDELRDAVHDGLHSAALRLEGYVVEEIDDAEPSPAVDRGQLRNSVDTEVFGDDAVVAVKAPHAAPIEYGTRPYFPPTGPLAAWVLRKGIATSQEDAKSIAFAIARKISEDGIAPRNYFAKAFARWQSDGVLEKEIAAEVDAVERRS